MPLVLAAAAILLASAPSVAQAVSGGATAVLTAGLPGCC